MKLSECSICDRTTRDKGRGQALPMCTFCREAFERGKADGDAAGRRAERDAIVDWLRLSASEHRRAWGNDSDGARIADELADAIEAGEHAKADMEPSDG